MKEADTRAGIAKFLETAFRRSLRGSPHRRPHNDAYALADQLARVEKHLATVETHYRTAFWHALDVAYDASLPHRDITCIVCEHTDRRSGYEIVIDKCIFGGGKLERYRCPTCDCIFGAQKYLDLDDDFVNADYQLLYARYSEGETASNEIRTFHSMSPRKDRIYLDWGCGANSKTLQTVRAEGFTVWGFEPSLAQSTSMIFNHRDQLPPALDGIFSNNVIEHFRSPIAQFKEFHGLLTKDGIMAHSSACYEYAYPFTRFHTLFLLGRSPDVLAERTGFAVKDVVRDGEYINYLFAKVGI